MDFTSKKTKSGDYELVLITDHHQEISFYFDGSTIAAVYIDGVEFITKTDTLHGVFVVVKGEFKSLIQIATEAEEIGE